MAAPAKPCLVAADGPPVRAFDDQRAPTVERSVGVGVIVTRPIDGGPEAVSAGSTPGSRKPIRVCVPSQNGLLRDAPQRQRTSVVRVLASPVFAPASTTSPVTTLGPSGRTLSTVAAGVGSARDAPPATTSMPSGRYSRSAPLGQRAIVAASASRLARSGTIHGFAFGSNTAGKPRTHSAACRQTAASQATTACGAAYRWSRDSAIARSTLG